MHPDLSRAVWRKSSYSGNTSNCVEVASVHGYVTVRDTKNPERLILAVTASQWRVLIQEQKARLR